MGTSHRAVMPTKSFAMETFINERYNGRFDKRGLFVWCRSVCARTRGGVVQRNRTGIDRWIILSRLAAACRMRC